MRYNYWTLRYLPDPGRGEFVNIGLLVGRDGADWAVRTVQTLDRASRLGGDLNVVRDWTKHLKLMVSQDEHVLTGIVMNEHRIREWIGFHNNSVQISTPRPVVASSATQALDLMFDRLVVEPTRTTRSTSYSRAVSTLGDAYKRIRPDVALRKRVKITAGRQTLDFDYALANDRIQELSRVWAFDLKDMDPQIEKVQAWGFRIEELRGGGGFTAGQDQLKVTPEVPVKVLYVPPKTALQRESLELAKDAWERIDAEFLPLDRADELVKT